MNVESITVESGATQRIVVTGGGTGGHVSPIIATIEFMRENHSIDFHWIGSIDGPERGAAERLNVTYHAVHTGKLRRYASLSTPADCVRVPVGVIEAANVLRRVNPGIVFSSGGFVGVPAVIAARLLGIQSLTHEQTAYLGLATRINSWFSEIIALSFEQPEHPRKMHRARVVVTGNPVRSIVTSGDPTRVGATFGLVCAAPLIYVTGGMRGAQAVNRLISETLPYLLDRAAVLHQCGPNDANGDLPRLRAFQKSLPDHLASRYCVVETLGDEIGDVYAAANLVIGRAGAGTVAELAAVGKPSVLIPLPGAEEQRRNALTLKHAGASILLDQNDATPATLASIVDDLLADPARLEAMGAAARSIAPTGAASRLAEEILFLAAK